MNFSDDDLENSLMAIEGFVLEHWNELDYLQNKQDFIQVSEHFIRRLSRITDNNKSRLVKEVLDSQELMQLLKKSKSNEMTDDEKARMQKLLIGVLKTIPTFVIISLPQRFLTLPILLKILPSNFFNEVHSQKPN
jgi:hypothetical protein